MTIRKIALYDDIRTDKDRPVEDEEGQSRTTGQESRRPGNDRSMEAS
ncbi:hypothetical protein MASR1M66_23270 [Aminivibrio sp.]